MAASLWSYDRITGALVGPSSWVENPERPDEPLQPAFTTNAQPPAAPAGQVAVFVGGTWALAPDHRGETWWNGVEPVLIAAPGDPGAAGLTKEPVLPPAPPPTSCTKLGLKRAFGDFWPTVRAAIAADPEMQEEWDLAVSVHRDDPLVKKMQAGLGLTDDQVAKLIAAANAAVV